MSYIGPNDGEGIRVYINGQEVANVTTRHVASRSAGDGRIVVGRFYTDRNIRYASVQVDELTLYESFDASGGLVLMEGTKQVDSVPLVSGKVN